MGEVLLGSYLRFALEEVDMVLGAWWKQVNKHAEVV